MKTFKPDIDYFSASFPEEGLGMLTRVRDNKFIQFNGLKSVFILKIAKFDLNANFKFITH
jgi:hypothetical protein